MSCEATGADIAIIRGSDYPPAMWQFLVSENPDVLFDLTGSVFKLKVNYPGGSLNAATDESPSTLSVDLAMSMVTWAYSIDDSRLLPAGRIATYELERWITGTQQVLVAGSLIAELGDNPD